MAVSGPHKPPRGAVQGPPPVAPARALAPCCGYTAAVARPSAPRAATRQREVNPAVRSADQPAQKVSPALLAVPVAMVLLAGLFWWLAEVPSSFLHAQVIGGPTEGPRGWSGRVQLVERVDGKDVPVFGAQLRVEGRRAQASASWTGLTDEEGWAEVELERLPGDGALELSVYAGTPEELVAEGAVQLSRSVWREAARLRRGAIEGRRTGELEIEVAVPSGVLTVPYPAALAVVVRREGQPAAGVELSWEAEGLEVQTPSPAVTDAAGRAELRVVPQLHVASLRLDAARGEGRGTWYSTLPIVPGAMRGEFVAGELSIQSPIERDSAWYTWVDEHGRLGGGKVRLKPDAQGASGRVRVPPGLSARAEAGEIWVVVSSEPDARSPSAVGWPLGAQGVTFDVPEGRLLDSAAQREEEMALRRARVRRVVVVYGALATLLMLALFLGGLRRERRALTTRLLGEEEETQRALLGGGEFRVVLGVFAVALGVVVLVLLGLLRLR